MSIKILKDIIYTKCLYASYVCSNIDNIKDFDKIIETKEELDNIYKQVNDNIPYDEIKKYVYIKENITTILNICKKNMMILIFCMYNMNVKKDFETKIIKYIHNQEDKIIFNSEMISKINEYSEIIKNFYKMYEKDKKENKKDENIDNIIEYGLSKKIIYNVLDLNNKDATDNLKLFSIIRYILTIKEYNYDKIPIIKIINQELFKNTETTFINLYYSTEEKINIDTIESLFTPTQNNQGYASTVYDLLIENKKFKINNIKEDINKLISSNIIYPITEEFLLTHNYNEKYGTQQKEDLKEINNTKFDYIFNKINNTIKNPIKDSKDESITINNYENIKLLNKMEKSLNNPKIMNNYNILKYYNDNIYVNYIDFIHSGFSYTLKNNCSSIRAASFNGKNKNILIRNCSSGEVINIIGFVLLNDKGILDLSLDDLIDNNFSLSEFTTNIYNKLNNKKYNPCYYLFDNDNKNDDDTLSEDIEEIIKGGKINSKNNIHLNKNKLKNEKDKNININEEKNKDEEKIKFSDKYCINLTSKLYDNIINILNDIVLMEFLKVSKENKEFDYKKGKQIIENIINFNLIDIIENNPKIKLDLIYKSSLSLNLNNNKENKEENKEEKKFKLYGYDDNMIKLKDIKIKKKKEILNIDLSKKKSKIENYDKEKIKSICQHYIDLNELMLNRGNKDAVKFNSLLYNFGVKYVKVNQYGDKFCKSCGEELNLGNFLESGSYNSDKQFVVQESFIITHLEDLDEYKQFGGNDGVINGLDNLLNKIASICDLNYLIGTKTKPRSARRELTKNIIDLIIENNKLLKNRYIERNKYADEKYNINRKLSCLYVFDLSNDVFKNLSDSKDFYKQNKFNNLVIFSLIMIALDMDISNIINLPQSNNKLIDFKTFKDVHKQLFRDIKLNTGNNIIEITKITLFCYIIYVLSTQLSKYNLYIINDEEKTKYNKKLRFNPIIQNKLIHSIIDIFNSIMENYLYIKNHKDKFTSSLFQLYDIITMKFFTKLNDIYTNKNVIDKFKEKTIKTLKLDDNIINDINLGDYKKEYIKEDEDIINLLNNKNIIYYNDKLLKSIDYGDLNYSNSLICDDGHIHEWEKDKNKLNYDGKDVKCINCNKKLSEVFNKTNYNEKLFDNYTNQKINTIGNKYCPSGTPHLFKFKGDKEICELCGYIKGDKIKNDDINKIKNSFYKYILINNNYDIHKLNTIDIFNNLKNKYNKDIKTNPFDLLSKYLLDKIGTKINIDNDEYFINTNIYIFDHNNIGYNLKENLEIPEDKIHFINNHPFFKEDVYYYSTLNKIEVYYSFITNKLLGYREQNKNYILLQSKNNYYAKIKYSIITKFKYIFFKKFFSTISNSFNIFELIYDTFINSFKFINELLTFIFMINNKKKFLETKETKTIEKEMDDLINADNKINDITYEKLEIEKYYSNNFNINSNDIFFNWNDILYSIMDNLNTDDKIKSLNINDVIDNFNVLNQYHFFNYLYYYIISEFINLDKKHNIITFIIDFINNFFNNNSIQPYLNITDYITFLGKINFIDLELDNLINIDEDELEKAKKQMENIIEGTDDGNDEINDGYNLYQDGDDDSDDDNLDGDINGLNREPGYFDLKF